MTLPRGVLFDLDGTLADTAADLTNALNRVLVDHDLEPVALADTREHVSRGASALLQLSLGAAGDDPRIDAWRPAFLDYYAKALCEHTRLFPGIAGLIEGLADLGIAWGVVTNKPRAYTVPLLDALTLPSRPSVLVCADDLAHKKPHPLPLRHACERLGAATFHCVYVGDDRRDVIAGFRAGTGTAAALWGYIGPGENPATWGADIMAPDAPRLADHLFTGGGN